MSTTAGRAANREWFPWDESRWSRVDFLLDVVVHPSACQRSSRSCRLPRNGSRLAPRASRLAPRASRLAPRASRLAPRASRLAPRASRLAPRASRLAPRASRLAPRVSELLPYHTRRPFVNIRRLFSEQVSVPCGVQRTRVSRPSTAASPVNSGLRMAVPHAPPTPRSIRSRCRSAACAAARPGGFVPVAPASRKSSRRLPRSRVHCDASIGAGPGGKAALKRSSASRRGSNLRRVGSTLVPVLVYRVRSRKSATRIRDPCPFKLI